MFEALPGGGGNGGGVSGKQSAQMDGADVDAFGCDAVTTLSPSPTGEPAHLPDVSAQPARRRRRRDEGLG